jgi:TolA-binding protein
MFQQAWAQPGFVRNNPSQDLVQIKSLVKEERFAEAYPLTIEWVRKHPAHHSTDQLSEYQEGKYYYLLCGLRLKESLCASESTDFLNKYPESNHAHKIAFHLGHYYFQQEQFQEALSAFEKSDLRTLTNEEIADWKFEMGYAYFHEKQFEKAAPLFDEIHQLTDHKHYLPANYYYGFIAYDQQNYTSALESFRRVERDPSYNPVVPYYVAEIYYSLDQKEQALIYVDSVLSEKGGSYYRKNLELMNAQLYFEKGQYAKALPLFSAYADRNEKVSKEVMYQLSFCFYKTGQPVQAMDGFKQLSNEKDSLGQNSMYILGELYLQINDKPNARSAFQFCASNQSNQEQRRISRLNYAKLSYQLGFQDAAMTETRKYLEDYAQWKDPLNEDQPFAHISEAKELLMSLLANTNDFSEGLKLYETLDRQTTTAKKVYARLLFGQAMQWLNEQRNEEADELLTKLVGLPEGGTVLPYAQYWKGELAYRKKVYESAILWLDRFIEQKVQPMGEATAYNAKYTIGYCYFQLANYKKALEYWDPLVTQLNKNASAMEQDIQVRKADCQFMLKNLEKADKLYLSVIDLSLAQVDYALYQRAMIVGVKDNNEKISQLKSLIKKYPNSPLVLDANMELAQTCIIEEKYAEAIPYLTWILESSEASGLKPKALLKTGLAYYNNNDNKNALKFYRRLLKEYPQSAESEEAVAIIKGIYIEEGNPDQYLSLMAESGITVAVNEADSLSYAGAFQKYQSADCTMGIQSLQQYLDKQPNGAYKLDAYFFMGLCQQKIKAWDAAIQSFENVLTAGVSKYYDRAALEQARIHYIEKKDFEKSQKGFEALLNNTTDPEYRLEALRGLVRTQYQRKEIVKAMQAARELLTMKGISTDDKSIANLMIGHAQLSNQHLDSAIQSFKSVVQLNKALWGAEARYQLAAIYFRNNNETLTEKYAMMVIQETGSYDEWVTRAYLLLGDLFLKQKDYFNAKATFESVANNATIEPLKQEAVQKLAQVVAVEKKSSKISN